MSTALLIIDVQHALCSGAYEAFEAARVIERINHVSRQFRQRGATVVVIQHEAPGTLFAYDSPGWQLAQGDRKSTRLNSSHLRLSRMPSSA